MSIAILILRIFKVFCQIIIIFNSNCFIELELILEFLLIFKLKLYYSIFI